LTRASCVATTSVAPASIACARSSSSALAACSSSSAAVGSSASRTAGRLTTARAIATRCACPLRQLTRQPVREIGDLHGFQQPDDARVVAVDAGKPLREPQVVDDAYRADQVEALRHEADGSAAPPVALGRARAPKGPGSRRRCCPTSAR
jgi:hypothetical protein